MPVSPAEQRRRDAADLAYCRALLQNGSRSFHLAARLLPRRAREPAIALYAFCRVADDAIDGAAGTDQALAELAARLDAIYAGRPAALPVDRAMARVVTDHAIPQTLPAALLEGFAWDIAGRQYETLADVRAYGARVAGSVGAMMALIMGVRSADALARACELGVAMQLTNIARDVGEDAAAGRLYLPRAWLREAGIDAQAWCAAPAFGPEIAQIVARLLAVADAHYASAQRGISALPPRCRAGIRAAAQFYAGIGGAIAANGHDSVSRRAVLSAPAKTAIMLRALGHRGARTLPDAASAAAAETGFLVDAVAAMPAPPARAATGPAWWNLRGHGVWVVELFDTLERRRRLDMDGAPASTDEHGFPTVQQR